MAENAGRKTQEPGTHQDILCEVPEYSGSFKSFIIEFNYVCPGFFSANSYYGSFPPQYCISNFHIYSTSLISTTFFRHLQPKGKVAFLVDLSKCQENGTNGRIYFFIRFIKSLYIPTYVWNFNQ